ncbi:hypothetical protein RHOSPDRAFT_34966 [Rhodotorula sp. JG-1b]|nr:hypothetical protein RHOSPDRAFT_34966 [Rhodotorula sp. JG-1b]
MESPPLPPRDALERVFASCAASDSLDSFTLKHVRTALAASPVQWACSDQQWKQVRNQVRQRWTALLEAHHAEQANSSDPESEQDQQEEEDLEPRTKYDRAAEKNVKVLLGAFGDFLGGLTGPASDLEDRSEEDEDATTAPAFPEKQRPAQKKKKRKSVALSNSESDPSDRSDEEEEERPRPSKKKKKQRKTASATVAAEKGTQASRASLSKSKSKEEPTNAKSGKRKSSEQSRPAAAAKEEITITDSEDSDSGADAIPKAQQQPVASTFKATPPPPAMMSTTMSMRDSDLSEVEDTGFLPGARRRSRTKGTKKGAKGKVKVVGTDEEEEEEEGGTTTSGRKGKGTSSSKEQKKEDGKKQKVERKAPAPKPGDAPKGTDAEEARIKKLKELVTAAGTSRPFTASTGAERTLIVSQRIEILEGLLEKLGLLEVNKRDKKLPSLSRAREVGEKRALEKEMQELGGTAHHTGLRTGKELHAVDDSSDDGGGGGGEKQASLSVSANKKKQVLAERKKLGAFLGAQSDDDSESD